MPPPGILSISRFHSGQGPHAQAFSWWRSASLRTRSKNYAGVATRLKLDQIGRKAVSPPHLVSIHCVALPPIRAVCRAMQLGAKPLGINIFATIVWQALDFAHSHSSDSN